MIRLKSISIVFFAIIMLAFASCKKTNQGETDRGIIEAYVIDNNLDGQFSASGLYYVITKPGSDSHPNISSVVNVDYVGYLLDGQVFDEGQYFESRLSNLIAGWQEGIQLIGEGGEITLIIPSALAYGSSDPAGIIGPNEVLAFDIKLNHFYD